MKKTILALPALLLALGGTASASQTWEDQSARTAAAALDAAPAVATARVGRMPLGARVPAGSPAFFANFVAAGFAQAGVPCFSCVNGAGADTIGLPAPYNYVPSGAQEQYNLSWTNLTFKGSCKVAIALTSGKTLIDSASFNIPSISGSGGFDIGLNFKAESFSGPAIVTGKLTCGGKSSSVKASLIFQ